MLLILKTGGDELAKHLALEFISFNIPNMHRSKKLEWPSPVVICIIFKG